MKFKQTPDVDVLIEVGTDELRELKKKGGFMLEVETKSNSPAYFWRVSGTWILLVLKETEDAKQS